ncbi:transcription antitermination factor NusB [Candidatus Nomurabacteria bacterium]|jgi:N utilization substance protein B|nr:transcription antitermination factor NusB [Candidatus Saccharibacteria bacterium]MCB9839252.1 transcription antitermination factor NusB [Candidatus Nomurabacteria bacterium]
MASNRHLGRIVALQSLYEQDFRVECQDSTVSLAEILDRNVDRYSETIEDKDFIRSIVEGVSTRQEQLDEQLQPLAPEWPLSQIARIDKIILRMGLYELNFENDVPEKVVINEAVELAKAFGSENSSKFINGVLGTALRNNQAKASNKTTKKSKKES